MPLELAFAAGTPVASCRSSVALASFGAAQTRGQAQAQRSRVSHVCSQSSSVSQLLARQFVGQQLRPFGRLAAIRWPAARHGLRVFAVEQDKQAAADQQETEEIDPPKPLRKLYPPAEDSVMNKVFWAQAIVFSIMGFVLAAELIPQFKGDPFWGIMGGWSMWMFVVPSVQARRPSHQARWAINWSFALMPFVNVLVPFVYKSFLAVFFTDVVFYLAMYWYGLNKKEFPEDQYVPSDEYLIWLEETGQYEELDRLVKP